MTVLIDRHAFALPRSAAPDLEIFAIGDIHGRSDLLAALLDEAAREPRLASERAIVFLGDLIDRGPDSLGAIDLAIEAAARVGAQRSICLMGNHEVMMRLTVDPAIAQADAIEALETWRRNGADKIVAQFVDLDRLPVAPQERPRAIRDALPPRFARWLAGLRVSWRSNEFLFVHAGVNPRFELDAFLATPWNIPLRLVDEERHWAWVRWPFLEHDPGPAGWSGYFVVHGHTPNDAKPHASHPDQIEHFRLNLDAGSGNTGVAEMAIIRANRAEVVAARGPTNKALRV
ncbi:MAG TPA: metallophosphoesterase [Roseiarcus sp.]|jgi:serine/threonine protein phosphatase 1